MKLFRIAAAILYLISGNFHIFTAIKENAGNILNLNVADGLTYVAMGIFFLLKKKFHACFCLIPFILSLFTSTHVPTNSQYFDWIHHMNYIELIGVICGAFVMLKLKKNQKSMLGLRWALRILSIITIVLTAYMIFNNTFLNENAQRSVSSETLKAIGVAAIGIIGLALSWRNELIGGIISLASFVVVFIKEPSIAQHFPFLLLFPLISILFIILWKQSKNQHERKFEHIAENLAEKIIKHEKS